MVRVRYAGRVKVEMWLMRFQARGVSIVYKSNLRPVVMPQFPPGTGNDCLLSGCDAERELRFNRSGDSIACQKNHDCATREGIGNAHWVRPDIQGDFQAALCSSVLPEG